VDEVKVGDQTTKVLAIYVVERDKPLATAWPQIQIATIPKIGSKSVNGMVRAVLPPLQQAMLVRKFADARLSQFRRSPGELA
jgi:hypothetical protein